MKNKLVLDYILDAFDDDEFIKIDGHDSAVIGVDLQSMRLIYSVTAIIKNLRNEMTEPEAVEFFEFNIAGSYVGEKTPILCEDYF